MYIYIYICIHISLSRTLTRTVGGWQGLVWAGKHSVLPEQVLLLDSVTLNPQP